MIRMLPRLPGCAVRLPPQTPQHRGPGLLPGQISYLSPLSCDSDSTHLGQIPSFKFANVHKEGGIPVSRSGCYRLQTTAEDGLGWSVSLPPVRGQRVREIDDTSPAASLSSSRVVFLPFLPTIKHPTLIRPFCLHLIST